MIAFLSASWPAILCIAIGLFVIVCIVTGINSKIKSDQEKAKYHGCLEVLEITDTIRRYSYDPSCGKYCVIYNLIAVNRFGEHVLFKNIRCGKELLKGDKGRIEFGLDNWFYKGDFDTIEG